MHIESTIKLNVFKIFNWLMINTDELEFGMSEVSFNVTDSNREPGHKTDNLN